MPDQNNTGMYVGEFPVFSVTGTVNINGGSAIAAGASVTENYTFTGLLTTDKNIGIAARDAVVMPKGLQPVSINVSATNTVTVTWRNSTAASITPPASATWTAVAFSSFFR